MKKYPPKKQRESIREFFNCDNNVRLEYREEQHGNGCAQPTTLI